MISAISDLQVNVLILPTKFKVNWLFWSRKEVQNRFSRWRPYQPSWILELNYFTSFRSTVQVVQYFQASLESVDFSVQKKFKTDFQDSSHGGHLGFRIWMILAIFDLQVTPLHPTVSSQLTFWLRRRSQKQIFRMDTMAAILDFWLEWFMLFLIYKSPRCFLPSFKSTGLLVQKKGKIDLQDESWNSDRKDFSYFWSTSHPNASYQVSSQLGFWFRRRSGK